MRKKKIIALYFKKKHRERDPFQKFGGKRKVYYHLFNQGRNLGIDMYIASGKRDYLGNLSFANPLKYNGSFFSYQKNIISADSVYDRSAGLEFPPKEISHKVLNCLAFKALCADKNMTYRLIGEYMPLSYRIRTKKELLQKLKNFSMDDLVVLKPADGLCGKGIFIGKKSKIEKLSLKNNKEFVLQEFVDTSCGIRNITPANHDLRVVIADGEISLAHVRTPRPGSLLANVAKGGSIQEIMLDQIPRNIIKIVQSIQKIIDKKFDKPVYSIDFGIAKGKPFVFELNDQIGFPSDNMKNARKFVDNLLKSLIRLSNA